MIARPTCNIPIGFAGAFGVLREPNGLYYMNARFYDLSIGRFLSEDPLGPGGGDMTLYSYAGSNPVVFVDPSGLCRVSGGSNQLKGSIDVGNRSVAVDFSNKTTLNLSLTKPWEVSTVAKQTYLSETGNNLKISNLSLTTEIFGHAAAYWLGDKVSIPKVSPFLVKHAGVANCGEWGVDGNRWLWDFLD